MLDKLKPDYFLKSLYDIPFEELKIKGIKAIIFDLDNTLTNWNSMKLDEEVLEWLHNIINMDFKVCVVSNNTTARILVALGNLHIPFVSNAFKPGKRAFLKAMKILKTKPSSTVVIGDQLFTDILGGNRVGMMTILIHPLSKQEFIGTKVMRKLEKVILSRF